MNEATLAVGRPLCFLHIAKTGGTSLADAISKHYPASEVFLPSPLSLDYLRGIEDRMNDRVFLAGHPETGVISHLQGRADLITMLRRPDHHAVSHYLHVLSDPDHEWHASALHQSFSDFLRCHPDMITFQSTVLARAHSDEMARQGGLEDVRRVLQALAFVGVIERAESCADIIGRLMKTERSVELVHLNDAASRGISHRTIERLRLEYRALMDDAELAKTFAQEQGAYEEAGLILEQLRHLAGPEPARPRSRHLGAWRFSTPGGEIEGRHDGWDVACPLSSDAPHIVFGPYEHHPIGNFRATFHLGLRGVPAGDAGRVKIDIFANGQTPLAERWLNRQLLARSGSVTLKFHNHDPQNILEFRIEASAFSGGQLVFQGVTIDETGGSRAGGPGEALDWRSTGWPSPPIQTAEER